ncbi:mariner Mos1 transposase [Trichonephila clavipes]|nr:mariner Mos1 transposase [Trichonephila clavipes]
MMKTAFGDEAMSRARVFGWFRRFKGGRQSMNSAPRSYARSSLAMRTRLHKASDDPEFMKLIITGDESWVYGYDPETKQQSSQWNTSGSTRSKKARQVRSEIKVMLIALLDADGIFHHEYAPQGQTVNKEFYLGVMRRLREAVRRKRPVLRESFCWMLHHDGASAHTANLVQQFLTKHGTLQLTHPPYSPDISPPDFFLFPKIKNTLKGHRFQDIETIKQNSTQQLQAIPKSEFQKCFED